MISNDANNMEFNEEAKQDRSNGDSAVNEMNYDGEGRVQRLCARFLQLSKVSNGMPALCSSRLKGLRPSSKSSPQRITSKLPDKALYVAKNDVVCCDAQIDESHLAQALKMIESNGTYLYNGNMTPSNSSKLKTMELIREKFEKISATSSTVPHKKLNKVGFRQSSSTSLPANIESKNERSPVMVQREIQNDENFGMEQNLPDVSKTEKIVVKLEGPNMKFSALPSASCLIENFRQKGMNDQINGTEIEASDESCRDRPFQSEAFPITTTIAITATTSGRKGTEQSEQDCLQEVHRLLKKFSAVREQRIKREIMTGETELQQYHHVNQASSAHLHSFPDSDSGLYQFLHNGKKEYLKNINYSNEMNTSKLQPIWQQNEETSSDAKHEKGTEENGTVATVSCRSTVNDGDSVVRLRSNEERWDFVTNGFKSTEIISPLDNSFDPRNIIPSNKSIWETRRKSLTAIYLEKKNLQEEVGLTDLQGRSRSSELPDAGTFKSEGPTRQSLLSLVMDEDVPELMEAMAEKLDFVFEDLTPSVSSAGEGILRNSTKRSRSRPKETKLEFHSSSPTVFTYPAEESAVERAHWDEGEQITFTVYRELCEGTKERTVNENRKPQSLSQTSQTTSYPNSSLIRMMEEPSEADSLLGVTGRISYNDAAVDLVRSSRNMKYHQYPTFEHSFCNRSKANIKTCSDP